MVDQITQSKKRFTGTNAERLALETSYLQAEDTFLESDTGSSYEWDGDSWVQTHFNGAALVSQSTLISGEDETNNVLVIESGQFDYETVAASQTDQVLGTAGAVGDYLESVIITASTGTITIKDDTTTIAVIPAAAVGVWPFHIVSKLGALSVTTAASTSCTCVGRFS